MFAVSTSVPFSNHREVDVFKEAASLAYKVTKLEGDRFEVGLDPHTAFGLKGGLDRRNLFRATHLSKRRNEMQGVRSGNPLKNREDFAHYVISRAGRGGCGDLIW
jgi:hypothetical protein